MTFEGLNSTETKKLKADSDEWKEDYILRKKNIYNSKDKYFSHTINVWITN